MKKLILIVALCAPMLCFAQTDTTKTQVKEQYCLLVSTERMLSSKFNVTVDFGEKPQFLTAGDRELKAKIKNGGRFESLVDALNQMGKQGWTLATSYILPDNSFGNTLHCVLRRKLAE